MATFINVATHQRVYPFESRFEPTMRRSLPVIVLIALAACSSRVGTPGLPPVVVMAPTEPRELLPDQQVQQVLNRLAFGPRPGDAERVRAMGVDRWIAMQLAPERIDDHAADELVARYETLGWKTEDIVTLFEKVQRARRQEQRERAQAGDTASKRDVRRDLRDDPELADAVRKSQRVVGDVQSAKLARAVVSERQLDEVMVDFWLNHFSVFAGKGQTRLYLTEYDRDVIRPHALGKFRDLLGAVAHSPAMLFYLDNWQSAADSGQLPLRGSRVRSIRQRPALARRRGLNENYARELMELHTLGVDGGYTQQDVINVARALTGWSIDPRTGSYVFRPQVHDAGAKVVLGHNFPAGHGEDEGEAVLDLLASHPSTAHFIAKKLVVRFVSDSAPPALVERAANTFLRTKGDIREVVRTIVTSPEFFSRAAYRSKVKSPFEVVASALRVLGASPDLTPRTVAFAGRLGQPVFGRQTPDGWPDRGDAWMNTGAILNRINFGLAVAGGRIPGVSLASWPQAAALENLDRERQADGVIKAILGGEASPETRGILVSGENPMLQRLGASDTSVRADATADTTMDVMDNDMRAPANRPAPLRPRAPGQFAAGARAAPLRAMDRPVTLEGLAQVVGLALGAPEFQRR